ncbi:hypothetical protein [Arthrobacter sp. KNU40]|uniref:hypothetical protein n=1 Tax=Arthrobacter sp. KNU40 TaxID=3447965 RepID=UPI003F62B6F6
MKHDFHVHIDNVRHFFEDRARSSAESVRMLRESFLQTFSKVRRQAAKDVLQHGIANGELKTEIDVDNVRTAITGSST